MNSKTLPIDSRRVLSIAATIVVALMMVAPMVAGASGTPKSVWLMTKSREWSVTGTLSFTTTHLNGYIICGGVRIPVEKGSHVVVKVNTTNQGYIVLSTLSTGGEEYVIVYLRNNLHIDSLTINGTLVCSDTDISRSQNLWADPSTLASSLELTVEGHGWTKLVYDGETVIASSDDNSLIKIYGITIPPPTTGSNQGSSVLGGKHDNHRMLYLNIGTQHLNGAAQAVEVNGREIPTVTASGLLLLAGILGAVYALASVKRRIAG